MSSNPRWHNKQVYVNYVAIDQDDIDLGCRVSVNKQGGATLSAKKYGGWDKAFKVAKTLAGWPC